MDKLKVGDKVRLFKGEDIFHRRRGPIAWLGYNRDEHVGKTLTVMQVDGDGDVKFEEIPYWYAHEWLEKVDEPQIVTVKDNGDDTFTFNLPDDLAQELLSDKIIEVLKSAVSLNESKENDVSKFYKLKKDIPGFVAGAIFDGSARAISDVWNDDPERDVTIEVDSDALVKEDYFTRVYKVERSGHIGYYDLETARKLTDESLAEVPKGGK